MKKLISSIVMFLGIPILPASEASAGQDRDIGQDTPSRLVGAWRLAWIEEQDADGKFHRPDCTGMLVATRDCHMSIQVMYRNPQAETVEAVQYAQGGYEATFGRDAIDPRAHIFTCHVEGSLVRSLVAKHLTRVYAFSGKQMIITSSLPSEHWRVAWERD
jgi:hypothetical protein